MKIKFLPTRNQFTHTIDGETVNGFDLSQVMEVEEFDLPELRAVGIRHVERTGGVLHVQVEQKRLAYQCSTSRHDWAESDWIDAADYDPNTCYIVPTAAPEGTETQWYSGTETLPNGDTRAIEGWTVVEAAQ